MIVKEYTIPLYRRIAEGVIKNTTPDRCDLYLDVDLKTNFKFNTYTPRTEIFNITRGKTLKISSNTTNIKVTNKFINNTPLFQVIKEIPNTVGEDFFDYIRQNISPVFLIEAEQNWYNIYLNTNKIFIDKIEGLYVQDVVTIGRTMYPSDIVKIKKIKDRLIIDIEVDSPKDYVIELGSEYLFEPRYYKNWVEFYEFIYKDLQNDIIYNKNYSFNFFTKKEVYLTEDFNLSLLKDPILSIEDIELETNGKYTLVTYPSWRSNLIFNTNFNTDLYFYAAINSSPETKFKTIYLSNKKEDFENQNDYLLILDKTLNTNEYSFIANEYSRTILKDSSCETYTIVDKRYKDAKYNHYNDIKFGNKRILTDIESVADDTEVYVLVDDREIYQEKDVKELLATTELFNLDTEYSSLLSPDIINRMQNLLDDIQNSFNKYPTIFTDKIKRYYYISDNNSEV